MAYGYLVLCGSMGWDLVLDGRGGIFVAAVGFGDLVYLVAVMG